jgi:PAS domain S-box-containing protein
VLFEYTEEEIFNIHILDFIHPQDRQIAVLELESLDRGVATSYFEIRCITKSGKIVWLAWTVTPSPDEALFFGVAKDITEKKELENLLDKANSLARIGSWEIDIVNHKLYWSKVTKEIHEVAPDFEPIQQRAIQFYKEGESRDKILLNVMSIPVMDQKWDDELQMITAKGHERWIRVIGETEFVNGKCIRVYGSIQDIDDRKKAEIDKNISNERYNLVSKATNDAIWDMDVVTGVIARSGYGFNSLFGYDSEQANNSDLHWTKLIHPDDLDRVKKSKLAIFKDPNQYYWEQEYRFLKANGHYGIVYDKGYIIRDENGKAIRMIGATQDISKLKENEIRLKELNENLQAKAKELADSNTELEQFAYVASHDLQEPLRMVTGFLTLLDKKYQTVIDEAGKEYINFAVDGAARMRQIIQDLLEFSRAGRKTGSLEELDLNELINNIQLLYRKQIEEKNAVIEVDKLPVITAHRAPVLQVFQNLIGNALKYTRKEVPVHIHIAAKEFINHWQFSIADNGIGIEKEYFDKIFIIFQRLHGKEEFSGTGIGLTISKKFIEKQGGKIWLKSEPGMGSTFYFTLSK